MYGAKCYRKNPQHLKDFFHPHLDNKEQKTTQQPSSKNLSSTASMNEEKADLIAKASSRVESQKKDISQHLKEKSKDSVTATTAKPLNKAKAEKENEEQQQDKKILPQQPVTPPTSKAPKPSDDRSEQESKLPGLKTLQIMHVVPRLLLTPFLLKKGFYWCLLTFLFVYMCVLLLFDVIAPALRLSRLPQELVSF